MERELAALLNLNDRGVGLMAIGDYQAASVIFRNSLQRVRAVAQTPGGAGEEDIVIPAIWKLRSMVPAAVSSDQEELQLSCTPFNRGFTIASIQRQDNAIPPDFELLIATLLYNTALAYDLRRKKNKRNRLGSVQRACGLYEQALAVLHLMPIQDEDTRMLLLATVNNRAVLALEMREYDTFEAYRDFLGQLIRPTDVFEYDFFACNVLATAAVREGPAPAA